MPTAPAKWFNRGLYRITTGATVWGVSDIRALLVTSGYTFDDTDNFVSDLSDELSGGGYARVALSGMTVTENDTDKRIQFDAADPVFAALGAAAGTPAHLILFDNAGGSDAARHLLGALELSSPPTPNGSDYTVTLPSVGALFIGASLTY